MSKNYTYAFENLSKGYDDLKKYFQSLNSIEELETVKEKICGFTLTKYLGRDAIERWDNLKSAETILNQTSETIGKYKQLKEERETKDTPLDKQAINISIAEMMVVRYQQDLGFIINDLSLNTLFYAIRANAKEFVKQMLQQNPSLMQCVDVDGWGAIHCCAADGKQDIMKILIEEFNANVDQRTEYFYTPALLAAKNYNVDCLIELMKHNADVTLTNRGGLSVMDFLVECSHELGDIINHSTDDTLHLEQQNDHLKLVGHHTEYNINDVLVV